MRKLRGFGRAGRGAGARAAWLDEDGSWQHHNLIQADGTTPESRRMLRSDQDLLALSTAVYAAIRRRSRAAMRPRVRLVRTLPDGTEVELPGEHPAWRLFRKVTRTLTFKAGMAYIEQHKLTDGFAVWVKRRDAFGIVREFDIWNPRSVEVVPDKDRPTEPAAFRRYNVDGSRDTVLVQDVVYFRNLLDPRNPLYGLGPISAARVALDTGLEALRYNRAFYDNDASPRRVFKVPEGGPAEVERVTQTLERYHRGTDRAHRSLVVEGDLELLDTSVTHEDMQFMQQLQWTVTEVARSFEMSPILLGDQSQATKENLEGFLVDFWSMMRDQVDAVCADFTEFLLRPDFDRDLSCVAVYDDIPFLQDDLERRARIDEIYLRSGKTYVNELRVRDREEPVPWGDRPLVSSGIGPLPGPAAGETPPAGGEGEDSEDPRTSPEEEARREEADIAAEVARQEKVAKKIERAAELRRRRGEIYKLVGRILGAELKRLLAVISANEELLASAHGSQQRPFPNEHACRLRDPKDFREGTFRRQRRKSGDRVYFAVLGKLKGEDTLTEQAYRYPRDVWPEDLAREHCARHDGILFEPATDRGAGTRQLDPDITDGYSWDWTNYTDDVTEALESAYFAGLMAAEFPEDDLAPAHQLAINYARERGGELLSLDGDPSLVASTRERTAALVARTIEEGGTLRDLKNALRADFAWSDARAYTVARTETAIAQGRATLESYRHHGTEGKEWSATGGNPCPTCSENDGAVVPLDDVFPSGDETVPAHPNCECSILPVRMLDGEEAAPVDEVSEMASDLLDEAIRAGGSPLRADEALKRLRARYGKDFTALEKAMRAWGTRSRLIREAADEIMAAGENPFTAKAGSRASRRHALAILQQTLRAPRIDYRMYRGMIVPADLRYKVGQFIDVPAAGFTFDEGTAQVFARIGKPLSEANRRVLFVMEEGARGLPVEVGSGFSGEREVIVTGRLRVESMREISYVGTTYQEVRLRYHDNFRVERAVPYKMLNAELSEALFGGGLSELRDAAEG